MTIKTHEEVKKDILRKIKIFQTHANKRIKKGEYGKYSNDFIQYPTFTHNVWGPNYAEIEVAKKINEMRDDVLLVPTLIMSDKKLATKFQKECGHDLVALELVDGKYKFNPDISIDVKLQDRAHNYGTINVEWSKNGNKYGDSTIWWNKSPFYVYVIGDDAYLINKIKLREKAHTCPDSPNRDNPDKITKRVSIKWLSDNCQFHFKMGPEYAQAMLDHEELLYLDRNEMGLPDRLTVINENIEK